MPIDHASGQLFLLCPASVSLPVGIRMVNIRGQEMASWNERPVDGKIMLDIRDLPDGLFVLHLTSGAETVTRKISIAN